MKIEKEMTLQEFDRTNCNRKLFYWYIYKV